MRHNLTLFTIIVLASLFTISLIANPIFAEKEGSIINATITILPADANIKAGNTKEMILLIDNSKNSNPITVKKISVLQWPSTMIEEFEVMAKSSKTETVYVSIPADTLPDKYSLVITVEDSLGKMKTVTTKLTVERFQPLEFSWLLGLLGAYLIPAQIIERVLQPIKNRKAGLAKFHTGIDNLTSELGFWTNIRTSIIANKIKNTKAGDSASKDAIEEWSVKESGKFYHTDLKQIHKKIDEISKELSKAKNFKARTMWIYATLMAILPAILFSYYGLGILQVIGYNGFQVMGFDIIINMLFIGSGTQPIHDIIGYITTGKKAQEKKVKI